MKINRGSANASKSSASARKGVQFLTVDKINALKKDDKWPIFKVSAVTTDTPDNYGNPYQVYFTGPDGVIYSKGYSPDSQALISIADLMKTDDEKKWTGKALTIGVEFSELKGDRLTYTATK